MTNEQWLAQKAKDKNGITFYPAVVYGRYCPNGRQTWVTIPNE